MGSVLVVEEGTLRGIVTDHGIAVRGLGAGLPPPPAVDAVMSAEMVTVDAADDVQTAYRTFRRSGVRRLPVLDGHRLVGAGHRPSADAGHFL